MRLCRLLLILIITCGICTLIINLSNHICILIADCAFKLFVYWYKGPQGAFARLEDYFYLIRLLIVNNFKICFCKIIISFKHSVCFVILEKEVKFLLEERRVKVYFMVLVVVLDLLSFTLVLNLSYDHRIILKDLFYTECI